MRFSDIPISPTSIVSTSAIAALLGVATILWPSAQARPVLAEMPVMVEELTITASPEDVEAAEEAPVSVSLEPTRSAYLTGETITLEARVRNHGDEPVTVSAAGVYDLAVQRVASPEPMGIGDLTFMALAEAGGLDAMKLQPGEERSRIIKVGADQPFDRPGRYRVTGSWLGSNQSADVEPFEVVIEGTEAIAQKATPASRPGA